MPDAFAPQNQGAFLSVLDFLDRPGQVVRNLLRGDPGAAGRQALDILGDTVDSVLPGDWIGNASNAEDYVSGGELVGLKEPGIAKTLADIGVGIVTDPLSFIPGKAVVTGARAAANIARKGAAKVVGEKAVKEAGLHLKSTFGALKPSPEVGKVLSAARAGGIEGEAGQKAAKAAYDGLDERQLRVIKDAAENFRHEGDKLVGELVPGGGSILDRILAHPEVMPDEAQTLADAAEKGFSISRAQKGRKNIFDKESQGRMSDEYMMRSYNDLPEEDALDTLLKQSAQPSAMEGRTKKSWEEVRDFLAQPGNEKVTLERDALKSQLSRGAQQGELAKRADVGAGVMDLMREGTVPMPKDPQALNKATAALGKEYAHNDDLARSTVNAGIDALKETDPESAMLLHNAYNGMPARGWLGNLLNKSNQIFKPAATAGYIIPKLGFNIRNRLSGLWSTISNKEARGATGAMAKRFVPDMAGAISDGLGLAAPDKLGKTLATWEDALTKSGGSAETALQIMHQADPETAALLRAGVLDGFVRSEDMYSEVIKPGTLGKLHKMAKWPLKIMKGVEDRMRLGLAQDLLPAVKDPSEAVRIARDTLFDYDVSSAANRGYRTAIPFGQFMAKAVPQQAKFLAENPAVAVGISSAFGSDPSEPIYPYMEGKSRFSLGADAEGNQEYLAGLGLPFEALNAIPNPSDSIGAFGRQFEQGVVGASQPLLKSAFSMIAGEDPYFQTPYGSYDKIPVAGNAGEAGRMYNMLAGTGLIQAVDSPLREINKLTDSRHGVGAKALDLLSGANLVSVDPDRALQQQLQRALETNPSVQKYQGFYDQSRDPDTLQLLEQFQAVKARNKAKREAQKAKGDIL